jgi:hypothetical protein
LKKLVNPSNKKLFEIIYNQAKELISYIESSEQREKDERKRQLKQKIEEMTKELEELN